MLWRRVLGLGMSDIDLIGRRHAELTREAFLNAEPPPLETAARSAPQPSRRVTVAALAGVAVVVVMLPVLLLGGPREPDTTDPTVPTTNASSVTTTSSLPTGAFPAVRQTIPGLGWEAVELPESVANCHEAMVATESEIYFWGGAGSCDYRPPVGDPGSVYTPDTGTWRLLPPSPLGPSVAPTGVWTGEEVIFCCGLYTSLAAAYSPETNSWRSLAPAPPTSREGFPKAVWTGSEMLVARREGVISYDPSNDRWRRFASPPLNLGRVNEVVWTGTELIVWPRSGGGPVHRRVFQGMALDPSTDTWRILPDPPAWPAFLSMVFTGEELIIWGGLPAPAEGSERAVGSRLRVATNEWVELPESLPEPLPCECNLGSQTVVWTGTHFLVSTGFYASGLTDAPLLIAYSPAEQEWLTVGTSPVEGHEMSEAVMAGGRVIMRWKDSLYVSPSGWVPEAAAPTRVPPSGETSKFSIPVPVGIELVAVDFHARSVAVVDFMTGTVSRYGRVDYQSPADTIDGASGGGEYVHLWADGTVYSYRSLMSSPIVYQPSRLRRPPGAAPTLTVVPAVDGNLVWLVQVGFEGEPTLLELVGLGGGSVARRGSSEMGGVWHPAGATNDGLVLVRNDLDPLTRLVGSDGAVVAEQPGLAISAGPTGVVILRSDGSFVVTDSDLSEVTALAADGAGWFSVGGPMAPTTSPPVRTGAHRFLVGRATSLMEEELVLVDGDSAESLQELERVSRMASWSRDNGWVILVEGRSITLIPVGGGDIMRFDDLMPESHHVLTAR